MSQYYPPYRSSRNNIKVELDLANYATKTDLNNITHVDVSSFASKSNLAALKTEVDKIDAVRLKTTPTDLAKLTNAIEHDVVKKTDYNTKVTSIEAQIAGLTKNTVDNLADITKLKAVDTNSFVTRTKFSADTNALDDKIDGVEKKSPDISGLATKASLNDYAKKADYVSNTSLTSQLNNLKSQHIAIEVTGIDNKTKKNANDILTLKNELQQKEYDISQNEIGISLNRSFFYYLQQSNLVYECKVGSYTFNNKNILKWKSTGVFNGIDYYSMNGIKNAKNEAPILKNDEKMYVYLKSSHFQQHNALTLNNDRILDKNVVNIYIVYKLDPITSRDTTFTMQDALFGAMQITKNADTRKYNYKGYGICFDESEEFTHVRKRGNFNDTTDGINVIIFGLDMSFSKQYYNIYYNTRIYAEKIYYRIFTDPGKKFVLSLHYNGNNSYLYVNGNQELKQIKTDQLVKEKLCLGNLSDQWTTSESEKTGLHGKIYDFVVDYEQIAGTTKILDMHRYLINKHTIVS